MLALRPRARLLLTFLASALLSLPAFGQEPGKTAPKTGTPPEVTTKPGEEPAKPADTKKDKPPIDPDAKVVKTDAEWRKLLTPAQYAVTRQKATEPAFTGKYATGHYNGVFACVGCGAALFNSKTKFDSGTGWPSFYQAVSQRAIEREMDFSNPDEARVEVMCRRCDSHLGHVFNDGPQPTGLRFCINSASIKLKPASAFDKNGMPKDEATADAKAGTAEGDKSSATADGKSAPTKGRAPSLRARRGARPGGTP